MRKLRGIVSGVEGKVAYYPGAMLDLTQPLAVLGADEASVKTLVCVSSFEVRHVHCMIWFWLKNSLSLYTNCFSLIEPMTCIPSVFEPFIPY